jgi:hypothetical protein
MKVGGERNYGYGKQLKWAGKQAIKEYFVGDRFSSTASHLFRWEWFCDWLETIGIKDARDITKNTILDFGDELAELVRDQEMKVSYAQNLISSVNVILRSMRQDDKMWVSPSGIVGHRTNFRLEPPIHMDIVEVNKLQSRLIALGYPVVAALVGLARALGMRFKECLLFDAICALKQARRSGEIEVSRGTKGSHARIITVGGGKAIEVIDLAASFQVGDCLIPSGLTFLEFRNYVYHHFYQAGGTRFHDFRASFACDLYRSITGCPAPVSRENGDPAPSKEVDRGARLVVSQQLGHHRIEVVGAYIGPILNRLKKS